MAETQPDALPGHDPARRDPTPRAGAEELRRQTGTATHRLCPKRPPAPLGVRSLQGWGARQHSPEPSPTPSLINAYWAFVLIMLLRVSCRLETPTWGFGASHPSVKVIKVFCQRQETVKDAASRSSGAGMGVPLREGSRDCPRSPRAGL